jgi:FtsP/CotA-like multicopper oxidase with cupredoxin domain
MQKPGSTNLESQQPEPAPAGQSDTPASRRDFLRNALDAASAIALAQLIPCPAEAQIPAGAPFANPAGIASKNGKLRAIMELNSEIQRSVPNVAQKVRLRYFQGWDIDNPSVKAPDLTKSDAVTPGPTLRAKLGDQVQIAFFNRVDDKLFPYTFDTVEGHASYGCDLTNNPGLYPGPDQFPNCFHGSSTANLHFHGTHTSPDGLADNVLVQVMPNKNLNEKEWMAIFEPMFRGPIPATWSKMPATYQKKQQDDVTKIDKSLWEFDHHQIMAGQWPQYIAGAFPNYFDIPDYKSGKFKMGQAPGTHWYHAHKHGSTSLHILSGLAGALIIEGEYDQFLRTFYGLGNVYPAAFEKILVIQNIDPNQNLERGSANNARTGSGQQLVNGMKTPTIQMRPNEVQLWRFVNATVGSSGTGWVFPDVFQTTGFQFRQTAMDGVQFSPANYKNQPFLNGQVPNSRTPPNTPGLLLSAGNRADVLVQAPSTPGSGPVPFTSNGVTLFLVNVTNDAPSNPSVGKGFPSNTQWPAMLPFLKDLGTPPAYPHYVTFGWDAEPQRNQTGGGRLTTTSAGLLNAPPRFTIDNKQFEEFGPIIDQCMPINGLQDWVLENHTTIPHPFHIHINPFQVMELDTPAIDGSGGATYNIYKPPSDQVWQDVIAIPAGVSVNGQVVPGRVRIRHQFVDFTGTYVLHCHILAHEDRGMMQLVRVVDAGQYPNACQANIPQHH